MRKSYFFNFGSEGIGFGGNGYSFFLQGATRNESKKTFFSIAHCPLPIPKNCQILDFDRALVSLWCHNWLELVAEIVTEEVPGNHLTMMYPPNVEVLAQKLQKYLDEAFAHTKL